MRALIRVAVVGVVALGAVAVPVVQRPSPPGHLEWGREAAHDTGAVAPLTLPGASLPTPAPRAFTLSASGDVIAAHRGVAQRARVYGRQTGVTFDFRPMLEAVQPVVSAADLAICHLETPLTADPRAVRGFPSFNAPREVADVLAWAGFDACSTASNHALDRAAPGVFATIEALDASGLRHFGTARSAEEGGPLVLDVAGAGARVGLLSYSYGLNGRLVPAATPWLVNLLDETRILADAASARARGAEVIVVSLHWGQEYQSQPTAEQRRLAHLLLGSPDIDLILGHHAHVIQPVERVGDKLVVYGMGNFLSGQSSRCCPAGTEDGVVVHVRFEEADAGWMAGLTYTPTWVEPHTYRVLPVGAALADPATPSAVGASLERSWARTTAVMHMLGAGVHAAEPHRGGGTTTRSSPAIPSKSSGLPLRRTVGRDASVRRDAARPPRLRRRGPRPRRRGRDPGTVPVSKSPWRTRPLALTTTDRRPRRCPPGGRPGSLRVQAGAARGGHRAGARPGLTPRSGGGGRNRTTIRGFAVRSRPSQPRRHVPQRPNLPAHSRVSSRLVSLDPHDRVVRQKNGRGLGPSGIRIQGRDGELVDSPVQILDERLGDAAAREVLVEFLGVQGIRLQVEGRRAGMRLKG